jgi:D-alanine-D-alanine ligase
MSSLAESKRVALIFGGVSPEHEISISSAGQVAEGLRQVAQRRPLTVQGVYINPEGRFVWGPPETDGNPTAQQILSAGRWELETPAPERDVLAFPRAVARLAEERTDAAMLILHGPGGEDGRLQAALDLARIPYTGSGAHASSLALHKPHCQAVLNAAGLPIAPSLVVGPAGASVDRIVEAIGLPCVVKPASGGSSVGVTIVREAKGLADAIKLALSVDEAVLVERFVAGRELTCGVLELGGEPTALPITEIIPPEGRFFDYDAKYQAGVSREVTPADLPEEMARGIRQLARQAHRAIGCRGFSRVDFILGADGRPVILEINTIPGMTATSLLPQAAAAHGIAFDRLVEIMLDGARHD